MQGQYGRMNFQCKTAEECKIRHYIDELTDASENELLGLLPGIVWVAEVAVRGSLEVLGFL